MPRALERFSCRVEAENGNFHLPRVGYALESHRESLQYLRLDFTQVAETDSGEFNDDLALGFIEIVETDNSETNDDSTTYTIGSLRGWPVLRTLVTSLLPIVGEGLRPNCLQLADMLPAGIVNLEILRDDYWPSREVVRQIVEMLGGKEAMVPGLKRLAVPTNISSTKEPGLQQRLRAACEAAAVTLVEDTSSW